MRKQMWYIIFFCVFVIGILPAVSEEIPITIITEDWPPYNYEENGEIKGFSVEIVQLIMKELNVGFQIRLLPGVRGEHMLDKESHVMNFSLFRTPERELKYKWIGPISEEAIYFYKKKGNPIAIETIEDAKKVRSVACQHEGIVFKTLMKAGFTNLDGTPLQESILKKVNAGRADLSVNATPLGVAYLLNRANLPADAIEQTKVKLLEYPLYIACTKDIPDELIQQWQQAFEKIKASGVYAQIYHKYLKTGGLNPNP